jgi:hypothetical protein
MGEPTLQSFHDIKYELRVHQLFKYSSVIQQRYNILSVVTHQPELLARHFS